MQKNVIAKAGETRGSRTALFSMNPYSVIPVPLLLAVNIL